MKTWKDYPVIKVENGYNIAFLLDDKYISEYNVINNDEMGRYNFNEVEAFYNKLTDEQVYDTNGELVSQKQVLIIPKPTIEEFKQIKLDEINAWTKSKITGGFVCYCYNNEPVLYDTDEETQLTMTKARANCQSEKFQLNFPTGMPCRGYVKVREDDYGKDVFDTEKTILLFTPEQIIAWDEDFSLFLAKCKGEGWIKQAQVEATTTKEELDAIILD